MASNKNIVFNFSNTFTAFTTLMMSNFLIGVVMALVYHLGKDSLYSDILIYAPILSIIIVLIRDKFSFSFVFSAVLAVAHGRAHVIYPFLNEIIGVNKEVDVWQDQILHLGQAVLFSVLYFEFSHWTFKTMFSIFVLGNVVNVVLGYFCWGNDCHDMYVWVSLLPALASGLHFATGSLYHSKYEVATIGFIMQGVSSITTYFVFKGSDDILKLFALCRFFEVYFIVPHYVGFFYSRFNLVSKYHRVSGFYKFLQVLGIFGIPIIASSLHIMNNYFGDDNVKIE
jgi:hypothetical protein